ncbi:hypothetical protein J437_LFUL017560 [Ladona fulva]|uniref:Major facilitator superfamily (MFS) profile domain-containing protein n=1 Tax=Ladona fulva TaxID=123851 RepID=A0A8K0P8A7_LADFU|nr:hypothetical protein J437_LFUL017560 [Ladona fulva]
MAVIGVISSSVTFSTLYLYSGELFPTVVRNSAMGIASMFARIGSMGAPFIATLGIYAEYYPPLIFGGLSMCGALLFLLLPETIGKQLPDTIEDGEKYFK